MWPAPTSTDAVRLLLKPSTQISALVNLLVHCWSYSVDITVCAMYSEGLVLMAGPRTLSKVYLTSYNPIWLAEYPCVSSRRCGAYHNNMLFVSNARTWIRTLDKFCHTEHGGSMLLETSEQFKYKKHVKIQKTAIIWTAPTFKTRQLTPFKNWYSFKFRTVKHYSLFLKNNIVLIDYKGKLVILGRAITDVYRENSIKHKNTICGKMRSFLILQQKYKYE